MRNLLLIAALLASSVACAQPDEDRPVDPYGGFSIFPKRLNYTAGVLYERVDASLSYIHPMSSTVRNPILAYSLGYVVVNKKVTLLLSGGYAQLLRYLDKAEYEKSGKISYCEKEKSFIATAELGFNSHAGRWFVSTQYCKDFFVTAGWKFFPLDL